MKNKRRIAIILYIVYVTVLVLAITFGTQVADVIIAKIQAVFYLKTIEDVTVDIPPDAELLAGKYYYPQYTAHGPFRGSAGLQYESLVPDYLSVTWSGKLYVEPSFEGDEIDVRVRVTSSYDKDFEKILTFRFVKKYPENFSVDYSVMGAGRETDVLYVGVPVFPFAEIAEDDEYNVTDHTVIYDSEYFTEGRGGSLVPTKATEPGVTLTFAIEYNNGARSVSESFVIEDTESPTDFDELRLNGVPASEFVGERGEDIEITLFKAGEPIATDYRLSFLKEDDAYRDGKGGMYFKTVGDKEMTVTLPSGYSVKIGFGIENKLLLPTIRDETVRETHVIEILTTDYKTFNFDFDGEVGYDTVTYEYDDEMLWFGNSTRTFTINPKTKGTTTLKLVIDDGYRRLEDTYTINIREDIRPLAYFSQHVASFVTKVLGHTAMFAVLALFSLNMFRYFAFDSKLKRYVLYCVCALPPAVLTELLQLFIPGRNGNVADVFVDMFGYLLGTGVILGLRCIYLKYVARREESAEMVKENTASENECENGE